MSDHDEEVRKADGALRDYVEKRKTATREALLVVSCPRCGSRARRDADRFRCDRCEFTFE